MDIIALIIIVAIAILLTWFITNKKANQKIASYETIEQAIAKADEQLNDSKKALDKLRQKLTRTNESVDLAKGEWKQVDADTKDLQALKTNADKMAAELQHSIKHIKLLKAKSDEISDIIHTKRATLHEVQEKLDLYTRLEEFVDHGLFEMPEYLYETSARFVEEIKQVREQQKSLVKDKQAITFPETSTISADKAYNKKILEGQVKLMLAAFNIECDLLIAKVAPSNFPRTLERIEKLANSLEKSAATLHCGFNLDYVEYKYQECQLQYQFKLKKQQEQEEQKLIREQIREEQKATKEYERAVAQAEKEERMYRDMLSKAREELNNAAINNASSEDRLIAVQRIADLERQLAEAEAKEERAKSMAQQTRKGHVYIISNIGSFGEDVYKIGLTRRLEPMDRVKELGDASVPFSFDVHAMIYTEDAPTLENQLHREFTTTRVNAVNHRKEFFRTDLTSIKEAVERLTDVETEFKMTILAEEYYESRRLRGLESVAA